MLFALVVGTLEEVVSDCLGGDATAVLADWCFGAVDAEEVLIEGGMAGA